MEIDVRPAEDADLDALRRQIKNRDHEYFRSWMTRHGDGLVLVAMAGARRVGAIVICWAAADEHEVRLLLQGVPILFRLRVVDAFRRRGVGRLLVRQAEATLRSLGHDRVLVGVDQENDGARKLFADLGYEPQAQLSGFEGDDGPYDILVNDL